MRITASVIIELSPLSPPLLCILCLSELDAATRAHHPKMSYPVNPPPSYGAAPLPPTKPYDSEEAEPLLFESAGAGPSHGNAVYDMPHDLPDDFKVHQS